MLNKITISQRLWFWASMSTLTFIVSIVLGWTALGASRDSLKSVHDDRLVPVTHLSEMALELNENRRQVLLAFQHDVNGPLAAAHDHPISTHLEAIKANAEEISRLWQAYMATHLTEEEKGLAADFDSKRGAWLTKLKAAVTAAENGDFSPQVMKDYLVASNNEGEAAFLALKKLVDYQEEVANGEYLAAEARFAFTRVVFMILFGLTAVLGTWTGVTTLRRLNGGFATAQAVAQAIAEGDLSKPVPAQGEDEIGQLLARMAVMRDNLNALIGELRGNIGRLTHEARELRGASSNVSATAEQQSEAASSMAAAVEELSVSIDNVEENAGDARRITQDSSERSAQSAQVIQQSIEEMRRIAQSVTETAGNISELEGQAGQITNIVNVIKDIADQTNLLALNAAIEAARAGEQGRGFAVVADEVRKLAERTSQATIEITGMIGRIQDGAKTAANSMEMGVARVEAGVTLASRAGEEVAHMQDSGRRIADAVDAIGLALKEQSAATRQIAGRVESVSQGTEEIAASARQTSGSSRELELLAENLERVSAKFRTA